MRSLSSYQLDLCVQMYAKFGGLGMHNCLLYSRVVKLRAENKSHTESIAYRTIATAEDASELMVHHSVICLSLLYVVHLRAIGMLRGLSFCQDTPDPCEYTKIKNVQISFL